MNPYLVKFYHIEEGTEKEEMFLGLHADTDRDAMEKYVAVTGKNKTEKFWNRDDWKFYTIPTD